MGNWTDRDDHLTCAINASHPTKTGRHDIYMQAMELVGNRHSKAALVNLVHYLLLEIDALADSTKEPSDV